MPVGEGGYSLSTHLRQAAHTKGVDPDEFILQQIGTEYPIELAHVFEIFLEMSSARSSDGFGGMSPIAFQDIKAWQELNGIELTPWELSIVRELDAVWMKTWNGRPRPTRDQNTKP